MPSPPPIRPLGVPHNKTRRPGGEHLTEDQVERIRKAALGLGRHGHRDATMILIAYTHALRVGELVRLRWSQINLEAGKIYIEREKGSISGEHPLRGVEIRALKRLGPDRQGFLFRRERKGTVEPITPDAFRKIVLRAAQAAGLDIAAHPHMLRHACGYKMVNDGVDLKIIKVWMGHQNVQNTDIYTRLASNKLQGLWKD